MKRFNFGYTLIEMLIVISIIGIILSIAIPNFIYMNRRSEVDRVSKELASMFNEAMERSESEMAFYSYIVLINNYISQVDGQKILQLKLLRYNGLNNLVLLKETRSKLIKIKGGSFIADQKLTCFTVDNKLQLYNFFVNYEYEIPSILGSAQFVPQNYNQVVLTVYSLANQNISRDIVIKDFPAGSVEIK